MTEIVNDCLSGLNHLGNVFSSYAANAFLQSALLVILLFGIDLLLRRRVRAVFRYGVWLLVLVKLVLPPTLAFPTGIGYWLEDRLPAASPVSERFADTVAFESDGRHQPASSRLSGGSPPVLPPANAVEPDAPGTPTVVSVTPITWQAVVFLLWLVGVLAFAALLAQRVRFVKGLVAASTAAEGELLSMLDQCRRQMGVHRQVGLRTSEAVPSPAVCGLRRPTILMPAVLVKKLSPEGLRAALIHELAHIKRGDLWINSVQTLLQVVYFYNPFVWFANAIIRRTCEEAVDETVLVALGGRARDYSNTLIDIGEMAFWKADFGLRLVGVAESRKALQWRIKHMLTRPVPKSARIGALGTIAILVVAAVLLPMARGEKSSQDAPAGPSVTGSTAPEKAPVAGESDTIIDANTGLRFTVAKRISGENDVIIHNNTVSLSPNGRFLLWRGRATPVDGGKPVNLGMGDPRDAAWSPDGKLIAYRDKLAIWLLPVSPETGQSTGPATKLFDDQANWAGGEIVWSADSQWIILYYHEQGKQRPTERCISARDGSVIQAPDYTRFSLRSPDQERLAYFKPGSGVWTAPVKGGASRLVTGTRTWHIVTAPLWWSPDGEWLLCGASMGRYSYDDLRFVRLADRYEVALEFPEKAGDGGFPAVGLGVSPDARKLLFFKNSHELRIVTKVAPIRGGDFAEVPFSRQFDYMKMQEVRAPEGQGLVFIGYNRSGKAAVYISPSGGGDPLEVKIDKSFGANLARWLVSPDGKRLLAVRSEGGSDLYVVPISLQKAQSTGPATLVFKDWQPPSEGDESGIAWSPDSSRLVICAKGEGNGDLWLVPSDGSAPKQLTQSPDEVEQSPTWSPDGKLIAYHVESTGGVSLHVIPADGGAAKKLWMQSGEYHLPYTWFPDSTGIGLVSDNGIVEVAVADGSVRPFLKLKEAGLNWLWWLQWSPDGQTLALFGGYDDEYRTVLYRASEKKAELLPPDSTWKETLGWIEDSQAIFCVAEQPEKVLPDALVYEVDLNEALQKAVAAAPPVQDRSPESRATPQVQPITGPVFSDNFDNGLSKCWQILDSNTEASPPAAHAVENGQLMLSNSSARLNQIDWTDYIVTVRVCVKESRASGQGVIGIQMRTTPCNFGVKNMDRYSFLIICNNNTPRSLVLDFTYRDASGTSHIDSLGAIPCTIVRDKWYTLAFEVRGEQLRGYLDNKLVIEATDARLSKGPLWISTWRSRALFDDFSVRQLP